MVDSGKKLTIFVIDGIMLFVIFFVMSLFYPYQFLQYRFFFVFFYLLLGLSSLFLNEYDRIEHRNRWEEATYAFRFAFISLVIFVFVLFIGKWRFLEDISNISYRFLLLKVSLDFIGINFTRGLYKRFFMSKEQIKNVLLVTDFNRQSNIEDFLHQKQYQLLAYVSLKPHHNQSELILTDIDYIRTYIASHKIDEIFIDVNHLSDYDSIIHYLVSTGLPISLHLQTFVDLHSKHLSVTKVNGNFFVTSKITEMTTRQGIIKRLIDVFMGLIGSFLTLLVALVIYPIIQKQSKGPLFFKQKRVGRNGEQFEIYKFRSMYLDAEERKKELFDSNTISSDLMFKMDNDPRVFPFGQKMRDWSLDELPQFFNVLKGDMSVVGTRPPTVEEYQNYDFRHFKRLLMKPGITGLWQVSGRSNITDFEKVVELDYQYISDWRLLDDIKIIVKTIWVVLKRDGSK